MRILGALFMAIAAVLAGMSLAKRLRYNERQAELSLLCLEDVKGELRYLRPDKESLFSQMVAKYAELEWLGPSGGGECFKLGKDFCRELGASDIQGQLDLCDLYIHRFEALHRSFQNQRQEKERLYISLGIFSGIALFILLI